MKLILNKQISPQVHVLRARLWSSPAVTVARVQLAWSAVVPGPGHATVCVDRLSHATNINVLINVTQVSFPLLVKLLLP